MSEIPLSFSYRLGGILTDADSVKFSNRTATFGIREYPAGEIVLEAGQSWTRTSIGVYEFDAGDLGLVPSKTYEFWIEAKLGSEIAYVQQFLTNVGTYPLSDEIVEPTSALDFCDTGGNKSFCLDTDSQVFRYVKVKPSISLGAVVEWILEPTFSDPTPHSYQLQWGQTDSQNADDWEDIGLPASDVFYLIDSEQRAWGHVQRTFYRVKLTTPLGTYYSQPQHCLGYLKFKDWRLFVNRQRIWRLQFERTLRGQPGFLLKRRMHGLPPTPGQKILDWQTDEVIDAQNEDTFGVEYIGGYYAPVCCIADLDVVAKFEHIVSHRGTVNDNSRVTATFLATPMLDSGDVWVSATSDIRWRIWAIQHIEEINGIPIALKCELRMLPLSHICYRIPVPSNPT